MPRIEPQTWDDALDAVLDELREIMLVRQARYGKRNVQEQGLFGVLTRGAADKVSRIMRGLNGRVVDGKVVLDPIDDSGDVDTFEDSLIDAANYFGPIAIMVRRGWWELPRKNPEDER